jgi:hypothetical protein
MDDKTKLILILLPLMILGTAQVVYAARRRTKLPGKFGTLFTASGVVTIGFAAALLIYGLTMLSS